MKLNIGCGYNIMEGWTNLDSQALPGVDIVCNLEECKIPLGSDSVDELLMSHCLEHIHNSLGVMQELHRIATPNALLTVRVPYGSSDDADEDQTHVRRYFWGSLLAFSQNYYWRADYGYRGDWEPEFINLLVGPEFAGMDGVEAAEKIMKERNCVKEMVAGLCAIKPVRTASQDGLKRPRVAVVVPS